MSVRISGHRAHRVTLSQEPPVTIRPLPCSNSRPWRVATVSPLKLLSFPPAHFFSVPICRPPIDFLLRRAFEHCSVVSDLLEHFPIEKPHKPRLCKWFHHMSSLSASPFLANARVLSHIPIDDMQYRISADIRKHPKTILSASQSLAVIAQQLPMTPFSCRRCGEWHWHP